MAKALGGASALSHLQLSDNEIDNDGALAVMNAVKDKSGLQVIYLSSWSTVCILCCVVVVVVVVGGGGGGGGALLSQVPTLPRCDWAGCSDLINIP